MSDGESDLKGQARLAPEFKFKLSQFNELGIELSLVHSSIATVFTFSDKEFLLAPTSYELKISRVGCALRSLKPGNPRESSDWRRD